MIGRREPPSGHDIDKPMGFDDYDVRLGDLMRGERATLSKSLLDVQRELKIRASYIAAIENCDVAAFETPGFIAGYVRSYARYLGMDPELAYARFCAEAGFSVAHGMSDAARGGVRPAVAPKPAARPASSDPLLNPRAPFAPRGDTRWIRIEPGALGSLAVLAVLIAGIGYGGLAVLREVQRVQLAPVDQGPATIIADLDPVQGAFSMPAREDSGLTPAAPPAQAHSTGEAPERLYRPQALDLPVMTARDGPIATISPGAEGALATAERISPQAVTEVTAQAAAEDATDSSPVRVTADGPPQVAVLAVRPAWVRVQAADGTVLFEKILDAGETYLVPQTEEAPRLRAGNSGSVFFLVDGTPYGPARPGPNVAANIALTADALRSEFTVADLSADPELARIVDVARAD